MQGFDKLQKQIEKLNQQLDDAQVEAFCQALAKELAARLLAQVIKRTPVGVYGKETGKNGGTLRRGWTAKSESEAMGGTGPNVAGYVQSLTVTKSGNAYEIEIVNPVSYASYVEYGHRQEPGRFVPAIGRQLKKAWVEGRFMLTISEKEIQQQAPNVLEKKLKKFLEDVLNVT